MAEYPGLNKKRGPGKPPSENPRVAVLKGYTTKETKAAAVAVQRALGQSESEFIEDAVVYYLRGLAVASEGAG